MILIDPLFDANGPRGHKRWCHMICLGTNDKRLHDFAAKIGLKREWFQGDHYDLTPTKRELAIKNGAVEVPARVLSTLVVLRRQVQVLQAELSKEEVV